MKPPIVLAKASRTFFHCSNLLGMNGQIDGFDSATVVAGFEGFTQARGLDRIVERLRRHTSRSMDCPARLRFEGACRDDWVTMQTSRGEAVVANTGEKDVRF